MKKSDRGFIEYGEFTDMNGASITIRESSLATKRCGWIFVHGGHYVGDTNDGAIHFNDTQARKMIKLLQTYLKKHRFGPAPTSHKK